MKLKNLVFLPLLAMAMSGCATNEATDDTTKQPDTNQPGGNTNPDQGGDSQDQVTHWDEADQLIMTNHLNGHLLPEIPLKGGQWDIDDEILTVNYWAENSTKAYAEEVFNSFIGEGFVSLENNDYWISFGKEPDFNRGCYLQVDNAAGLEEYINVNVASLDGSLFVDAYDNMYTETTLTAEQETYISKLIGYDTSIVVNPTTYAGATIDTFFAAYGLVDVMYDVDADVSADYEKLVLAKGFTKETDPDDNSTYYFRASDKASIFIDYDAELGLVVSYGNNNI